jgi:hypothetical protein
MLIAKDKGTGLSLITIMPQIGVFFSEFTINDQSSKRLNISLGLICA